MARRFHIQIDVRNTLLNWSDAEWDGACSVGGRKLSAREAKAAFLDELAKGRVVLPAGEACEGFDPTGGGCPGHDVPEGETEGRPHA